MRGFRWPALVLVPSLLVGAAVYDDQKRPEPVGVETEAGWGLAVLDTTDQITTWFCAAASLAEADVLTITNPTADDRSARITFIPAVEASGQPAADAVDVQVDIEARGQVTLRPFDETGAGTVSAVVELDGGGVLVEHVNTSVDRGSTDRRPCATEAGAAAYLPVGTTADDARMQLLLFNPFPDDAVVDVSFDSDLGRREPQAYEGLVIPGRSARLVNLADEVPQRGWLTTFVEARSGRIVVDRILEFDGSGERSGLSVATGIGAPRTFSYLPVGQLGEGRTTSIVVQNPSSGRAAEVDITILVSSDRVVEPLERRIFQRTASIIDLSSDAFASTLEGVDDFSIIVESTNGVPVAVERLSTDVTAQLAGTSTSIGSPLASTVWLADIAIADPSRSSIVIINPSFSTLVQVEVYRSGSTDAVATLELRRGGRAVLELDKIDDAAGVYELVASSPVVVERDLVGVNSRSTSLALPVVG